MIVYPGMLPTLVAWLIERRQTHRYAWYCVGGLNAAGVLPFVFNLWAYDNSIGHSLDILASVSTFFVMYMAAAFGWLLYNAMPSLIGVFIALAATRRSVRLRNEQKKLIEEWGEEVTEGEIRTQR